MASPFTEMEWYTVLFSLVVFSFFTLYGLIQERCVQTTGMSNTHKQQSFCVTNDLAMAVTSLEEKIVSK